MSNWSSTNVKSITSSWEVSCDYDNGLYGVRKYIDGDANVSSSILPNIGTAWSSEWSNLIVKKVDIRWLSDDPGCKREYTVTYGSKTDGNISVSVAADYLTYTKSDTTSATDWWYWSNASTVATDVVIPKREPTIAITYHKDITSGTDVESGESDFVEFLELNGNCAGKVNSGTFTIEGWSLPKGLVLYEGCEIVKVQSIPKNSSQTNEDTKYALEHYMVDCKFNVKLTNGQVAEENGWNKMYNKDTNTYDTLLYANDPTKMLYEEADIMQIVNFANVSGDVITTLPEE